jgi:hypothetical protein
MNIIDDFLVAGKREQGGDRLKANFWTLTQLMVLRPQAWEERTHQGGKHQIWETRGYEKDMIVNHSQSWSTVLKDAGIDENLVIPQYECWGHSIYFRLVVADGYGLKKKSSSTPGSGFLLCKVAMIHSKLFCCLGLTHTYPHWIQGKWWFWYFST